MINTEITGLVLSGVSALSNAVQAYEAARNLGKDISISEILDIFSADQSTNTEMVALNYLIDDEYLEVLLENIENNKKEIITVLRNPEIPEYEKDRAINEASKSICEALKRIKQFNDGVFPEVEGFDLHLIWRRHGCC